MKLVAVLVVAAFMAGCSNWIYRIDIPQGNFLEQKDVNQLRVSMTQEQVRFVLGNPVVQDSFDNSTWYYVYDMKRGMKKRGEDFRKELVLKFDDGRLSSMSGDFETPEEFEIPLEG
ncbi:outer membrane protein assembly factor BamE [Agaribacter flavus]|uniref:Outer membrane protein assembly factor BamE n=1 Tax=Agaribacter flavus TaxID=1902781 RepID=A0ABV7FN57_9ALTE